MSTVIPADTAVVREGVRKSAGEGELWLAPEQVEIIAPGLTKDRLQYLRDSGKGPRFYRPSARTIIYARSDIDAWIRRGLVTTRDDS